MKLFLLDNDETGNKKSEKLIQSLLNNGYNAKREAPMLKDFRRFCEKL
jgi:hypothetical protein